MNDIKVTIICETFNHEKYIRRTLDGFLKQIADFRYRVIVHDDASSDNTAEIIREYARLYPNIITPIYQVENQYSKGVDSIREHILPKIEGKYIALCEGDDYWCANDKLQRQIAALEKNPECKFAVHKVQEVFENDILTGHTYPPFELQSGVLSSRDFLTLCKDYSFHTSSYMFDCDAFIRYLTDPPEFRKACMVGDEPMLLYFGQLTPVYYDAKIMSNYRRGVEGSWTNRLDTNKMIRHSKSMVRTLQLFDLYTDYQYHDICTERISKIYGRYAALAGCSKDFFLKENKSLWRQLGLKHKVFVLFAAICPKGAAMLYARRFIRNKMKTGKRGRG